MPCRPPGRCNQRIFISYTINGALAIHYPNLGFDIFGTVLELMHRSEAHFMQNQANQNKFLPATAQELEQLGWRQLDVILVTGDTYLDAPHIGVAVVGRVLQHAGYRVGIIAQPDIHTGEDITRLGEPRLFWGVSGGCVDSMIANFTPTGKRRKTDDMTPGGLNQRRPDRAVLAYSHLIRRYFKQTRPIVLGGIEASLRRISHYDAWTDKIRRSILFDAKADYLLYGMAEHSIVALADALRQNAPVTAVPGLCYISHRIPPDDGPFAGPAEELPSHEIVGTDKAAFARMFERFYANADPWRAKPLYQRQDTRYLIHNPPAPSLTPAELDAVYALPFQRAVHPYYQVMGPVNAVQTIQFSVTTHRGCFGQCRFCAIAVHQGRQVVSRTQAAIVQEVQAMTSHPDFKGIVSDIGGPTANMYGMGCRRNGGRRMCAHQQCLYPTVCKYLAVDHSAQIQLLNTLQRVAGIRKLFVASGLRYDLILADSHTGVRYLETLLRHHTSGQLKIAPEHIDPKVLALMGKPPQNILSDFMDLFARINRRLPQKHFLTYYLMAAHPGCTLTAMQELRRYAQHHLHLIPEQVQIFTPSPSTYSTLMYYLGSDPFSNTSIFVERGVKGKMAQKAAVSPQQRGTARRTKKDGPRGRTGGSQTGRSRPGGSRTARTKI